MFWPSFKIEEQMHISEMFSFFKAKYDKTYYFAGEMHPFWECVYVLDGSICVTADERMYNLSKGEVVFHKPFEMHKFHITDDTVATVVIFSFSARGDLCKKLCDKVFTLSDEQRIIIEELLIYADRKSSNPDPDGIVIDMYLTPFERDPNYSQMLVSYLYRFMLSISESAEISQASTTRDSGIFSKAIEYMNASICNNPTVDEIARYAGVSTAGLKRIFMRYAGLGVHKFFLKLKLKSAAQMLECGALVTEVSEKLGFSSQAYFSRAFKRETNIPPSKYSDIQKKNT